MAAKKKAPGKQVPAKAAATKKPARTRGTKARAATTATKRLATYQRKRDFAVTAEPSGNEPPPSAGNRFVVQRHRASRLHYDFRLEADGVLVSWAVPKGPTLDPDVKRMAVHVEDHPLDYFDFEGVIPSGQYGGGDVIVWDWGTWAPADGQDPLAAIESVDLHVDLHGQKLHGRFVLVRRGGPGDKEQWLLLHKHDEHAVAGWDPEEHPESVKSGRTNDEVKAAPPATWSSSASWAGATAEELEALDALGKAGEWQLGPHTLKLTNLDKPLFPGHRGKGAALTKRDLVRHHATMAPAMLPYLAGRPVNLHRFPDGVTEPGFWQKAVPSHAPDWLTRWHYDDHGKGETEWYLVLDSAAALAWVANYGAVELHPWTSRGDAPHQPTWAMIDIDPGTKATFDDALVLARLFRTALAHLDVQACPKVTGKRGIQIWVPVADGSTFEQTQDWVEAVSHAVGDTVPEMVSWEWTTAKRGGLTRLDYTQNAINKTLVAPFSARPVPGAPVSVPITWDELDDPDLRPDGWTIRSIGERLATSGDPLAPLVGVQQRLPRL
jgi:bifunctional non-homologous end joining protein LigD